DEHQFGAERADRRHLLGTLIVGHDDDRLVAERVADERQSDAGVARRALDDRAAGAEAAVGFGIADDIERRAVLHRTAGIGIFALAPDFAAGGFARPPEQYQGGIADEVEAVCSNS